MEMLREFTDDDGRIQTALPRRVIVEFDTPFLRACLRLFFDWKRFKVLPHGGGTLQERQSVIDILTILDAESNKFDEWEREKNSKRNSIHGKRAGNIH